MVTDLDEETAEEKDSGEKDDPSFFQRGADESAEPYARRVFQRVFCDDIQRVLRMDVRTLAIMMEKNAEAEPVGELANCSACQPIKTTTALLASHERCSARECGHVRVRRRCCW